MNGALIELKKVINMNCPNTYCRRSITPIIKYENDGGDNIHNLPYQDLICPVCNRRFLNWLCGLDKIKQAFGSNWALYQ